MKPQFTHQDAEKTWALIVATGDEVTAGLQAFARQQQLSANHFTAIGALSQATVGSRQHENALLTTLAFPCPA